MQNIDLNLCGYNQIRGFINGSGKDLLIACGCSWTRAWGSTDNCLAFFDPHYQDDLDFVREKSYVGRVAEFLNINQIFMLATPGSNNETQSRLLIEFLQKNRHKFDRVFVLWGLTSHLRWELYSNNINAPSMFMLGSKVPAGKEKERQWHLVNHWNEDFELLKLGQKIVLTSSYLKSLNVEHLFFPVFESFNSNNMNLDHIADQYFFKRTELHNDMLSQWCIDNQLTHPQNILSNPYAMHDKEKLKQLTDLELLNPVHGHPSAKGHKDIADRLITHLNKFNQS
jgi:hypothetical protein